MPPKRMTANPVKPARYRAGKPTGAESDSDSDASENEQSNEPALPPPPKATSAGKISSGSLGKVDLNARRKEAEAAEERRLAKEKAERLAAEEGFVTEEEEESEEEEDDDEEEESESEEESSEDEAPRRLMIRPKFVPKSQRGNAKTPAQEEEEARQAEEEARKKAADELHWDDDENEDSDVDTTDGLDPEAEEAAWRVRELKRLKRARAIIEEREKELAEVERRRNLTEEERQAEDEAFLAQQKEEKEGKGKMSFMQRYLHKGAFYQDEMKAAGLDKRDIMGSRIQDDVRNREALPEYLQRRDMAKLGRKGATKYRDMRTEDTGRWGDIGDGRKRDGGRFEEDERFRPDDDRFRRDERSAGGANAIPLGDRKRDDRNERDNAHRDRRDRDRDSYRSRDDGQSRRRSRSRSRSPRRENDRDDYRRRKRSTSRDDERYESDKRRRVDAR
ncbi:Uncharacterized protein Forpi1262_v002854 [Fusarium oxysporum f. sp. raphani]|uniref:Micro-fibrillar-associated protein 1 C-terminal domain-containing protein n=1 Tax=Fusarium oxysporum f. sp. raphani TaxID=96318 RepID=A0A8J5Q9F8_FUSOX|nr:Uncharacterized protein Forpi1262_v002854 [Fusarium oxysporum f. sp. raphani]